MNTNCTTQPLSLVTDTWMIIQKRKEHYDILFAIMLFLGSLRCHVRMRQMKVVKLNSVSPVLFNIELCLCVAFLSDALPTIGYATLWICTVLYSGSMVGLTCTILSSLRGRLASLFQPALSGWFSAFCNFNQDFLSDTRRLIKRPNE